MAIAENPADARRLTIKRNTIAVVTDGSAVLGLGNIGPAAALPVMEGKALLFKRFGGVDAWPVCLDTQDSDKIVEIVKAISPVYGGVNLEDISAPRCFEIEERLRAELDIPVFHDDQHGTAIVVLAALINALRVVHKDISQVRFVISGVGAAGSAIIRLLIRQGATMIIGCDLREVGVELLDVGAEVLAVLEVELVLARLLDRHREQQPVLFGLLGDARRRAELLVDEAAGGVRIHALLRRLQEPFEDQALRVGDLLGLLRRRIALDSEHLLLEGPAVIERQDVELAAVAE